MNISTSTDHVLTPPKGKEFESDFLTVPEVASLLKIRVDEVLLLIFANMLPSIWRDQAAVVKREDLHAFAMTVAMGLKESEPFNTGLQRFIEWVRQSIIQPGLQDTSFDIMNAALNEVVNETELLVSGLISGEWSPDPDREDSTRELFQRANNANKDILAIDFESAQQEQEKPRLKARGRRSVDRKMKEPEAKGMRRRPPPKPQKAPRVEKSRDRAETLSIADEGEVPFGPGDFQLDSSISTIDSLQDKSPSYKAQPPAEPVKIEEADDDWRDDGPALRTFVFDDVEGGEGVGIVATAEEVEREIYFDKDDCSGDEIDDCEEPECEEDGLYEEDDELCLEDSSEVVISPRQADSPGGGGSGYNTIEMDQDTLSLGLSDAPAPDIMDSKMAPYEQSVEPSPIVSESPMPPSDPFGGPSGSIGNSYGSDPFGDDAFGSVSSGMSYQAPSMPVNRPAPPGLSAPSSQMASGYFSPPTGAPMPPPMAGRGGAYSNAMPPPSAPPPPPMPSPAMAPRMSQKKGGLGGLIGGALSAPFAVGAAAVGAAADLAERAVESRKSGASRSQSIRADMSKSKSAPAKSMKKRAAPMDRMAKEEARREQKPTPRPQSAPQSPQVRQIEIETVERRTTVRHHKQMYLQKSYPLFVIISQHKIKKLVSVLVDQVTSKKAFNIKKSNPIVHIRPIFPGCLCVPAEMDLDVTERVAEGEFWLTPQALGELKGARVEIIYEGKVVDTIKINCTATTQALAKLSGSAAFITTSFGPAFEALGKTLKAKGVGWAGDVFTMAGSENGPLITSAILGIMTVLFYLWNRPREADPIQNMFDYEMDSAPRGSPHVMKQKCRLVLLSRTGRQKFELVEEKTTMGRTADCLVTLKERSVSPKHAEINFDPDLQEFSVRPLDGSVKVNGIDVGRVQKLPRDAVIEFGGDVSFWFYDEREDASGWDRAHIRAKIEQKLIETLGSFTAEIQAAFRDPKNKTVRAALAVLMVKGVLTPKRWSLIKKAAGNFLN